MLNFRCIALLALVFLSGCASQVVVNSDYAQGTDFSQYQSYRWSDANNVNLSADEFLASEFVDGRVHAYVDNALRDKGYIYREQGPVDLLLSYKINSEQRQRIYSYGGSPTWGVGLFNRYDRFGYGVGINTSPRINTEYFQLASLVLDFVRSDGQLLIWRGKADLSMPQQQDAQQWRENLQEIVSELLKKFPDHHIEVDNTPN